MALQSYHRINNLLLLQTEQVGLINSNAAEEGVQVRLKGAQMSYTLKKIQHALNLKTAKQKGFFINSAGNALAGCSILWLSS